MSLLKKWYLTSLLFTQSNQVYQLAKKIIDSAHSVPDDLRSPAIYVLAAVMAIVCEDCAVTPDIEPNFSLIKNLLLQPSVLQKKFNMSKHPLVSQAKEALSNKNLKQQAEIFNSIVSVLTSLTDQK